ncbi:MAG: hypothetical protein AAFN77_01710 [Planctomycetota bacterium]
MDPATAQMILLKCTGDDIWDRSACRSAGVPEAWVAELIDRHESGFDSDQNTIYVDESMVNQYEGVHDLKLALKVAEYLGIDWQKITSYTVGRRAVVAALKAELDEI